MDDPIIHACSSVAHAMGIDLRIPQNLLSFTTVEEKLEAICQASAIQKRAVFLEDEWWRQDHGPLICFWKKTSAPVALIHRPQYQLLDPEKPIRLTKEVAEQLLPNAYMFYAPLDIHTGPIKQILKHIAKNRKTAALFSILSALSYALFPSIATKLVFQYAIPENSHSLILYLTLGVVLAAFGLAVHQYWQGIFITKLKGFYSNRIIGGFWGRLLQLPSSFFRKYAVGDLSFRTLALNRLFSNLSVSSLNLLFSGIFAVIYLFAMLYFSFSLGVLVCVVSLIAVGISGICSHLKIDALKKAAHLEGSIHGAVLKLVVGIEKLRSSRSEDHAYSYWSSLYKDYQSHKTKARHIQNIAQTANHLFPLFSMFLIYFALFEWIPIKAISLSDFLAFNIAFSSYSLSVYPLGDALLELAEIPPLWGQADIFLKEPVEKTKFKPPSSNLSGEIQMENVVFSFDPNSSPILDGVSLTIKPGELIGIVGEGKTALLHLLAGLEKPQSGMIFYDGKDLKSLDTKEFRNQLGIYFQNLKIFSSPIMGLFLSGGIQSPEEIQKALQFADFEKDLANLPLKLTTRIDMLSGSQKERLLLANAVIGQPPVMLLDDPTASLDSESRARVNVNIENQKATRIYATNRAENLRKADRIYVLSAGKIVQTGTFAELIDAPGFFSDLFKINPV